MPKLEEIEVVPLPEPYNDPQALGRIAVLLEEMFRQKQPGFQIDVGDNFKGVLAATHVIERETNDYFGHILDRKGLPRFALSSENLMPAFARRTMQMRSATLGPHEDTGMIGPAIHHELMHQKSFPVQLAFVDCTLPELDEKRDLAGLDYDGEETLHDYASTVWEGEVREGRLTVFSQGGDYLGLKPSAHFFDRRDMAWRGCHTRYACTNLERYDWKDFPYDDFVENRIQYARKRNTYDRWREISEALPEYEHTMSSEDFAEKKARTQRVLKELEPYAKLYLPNLACRPGSDDKQEFRYDPRDPEFDFSYAAYTENADFPKSVRRPITDYLFRRIT